MKKILFFLLLALPGFSQNFKLPRYEKLVLPNGLTLMLMEQHEVPVLAVSVGLPAGAVYDGAQYGLANLTAESLKFGTKSFPKALLDEKLDFLGAQFSTYATLETASLTSSFAVKDQETIWPMIKEVLVNPAFDAGEFEKRKSRLLVELKQAKQRPSAVLGEYFNHFYYGNQPYGSPADGTPESIGGITLDQVKNFYRTHYQPNGTVVSVVGDFNTAAMKAKLTTLFKDWKKGTAATQPPALKAVPSQSRVLLVNKENATETQIMIGQQGVAMNNPDYVGIEVVNTVLGARFTSWLVDELRVNHGYTYGVRSSFDMKKAGGTFVIRTFTPTKTTIPTIDLALEVIGRLYTKGIDEKLLASAKNYVKGQFPPRFETPAQLASLLTTMFTYGLNDSYINDFQAKVDALNVDFVKRIIQTYFPKDHFQLVVIGKTAEYREAAKKYGEVSEKQIETPGY